MAKKFSIVIFLIIVVGIVSYFLFFQSEQQIEEKDSALEEFTESVENPREALDIVVGTLEENSLGLTKEGVEKSLVGTWNSLDREGYVVEFSEEGKMFESLGPSQTVGQWTLVDFNEGPNEIISTVSFSKDGVFLKQGLDEGKSNFYYKIVQADENRLVLIYLLQGGILGFERAN